MLNVRGRNSMEDIDEVVASMIENPEDTTAQADGCQQGAEISGVTICLTVHQRYKELPSFHQR